MGTSRARVLQLPQACHGRDGQDAVVEEPVLGGLSEAKGSHAGHITDTEEKIPLVQPPH